MRVTNVVLIAHEPYQFYATLYKMIQESQKGKKVYVYIDVANMWSVSKSVKKRIDYAKLKEYLQNVFNPSELKIFYYDAYPKEGTRDYSLAPKHRYFVYLKKGLKFTVRKKPLKQIKLSDGTIQEKGYMDVELAIDVVHNAQNTDIALFFSGDSDFLALINYLKSFDKESFVFSSSGSVSTELRTGSDGYFDMKNIKEIWGEELKHRKSESK